MFSELPFHDFSCTSRQFCNISIPLFGEMTPKSSDLEVLGGIYRLQFEALPVKEPGISASARTEGDIRSYSS